MRKSALMVPYAPDEPNLVVPLATSYNERGVQGYSATVTNSQDQRKINCFYEIAKNAATGKGTLTLSKRPGTTASVGVSGSATQTVYLISSDTQTSGDGKQYGAVASVVFNTIPNGANTDIRVGTTVILSAASGLLLFPYLIDTTLLAGAQTFVLQIRATTASVQTQRVFFATTSGGGWTEIVDADFTGLTHCGKMENMDGFLFVLTGVNKIFNSDVSSLANWTASSFISKQIVTDIPVGLARLNSQILAFGEDTVEAFYNAGNTVGSPLSPIKQLHHRIGMIVPPYTNPGGHYYCIINSVLYFVGRQAGGIASCGVFAYDGQNYQKVSSSYIDKLLSEAITSSFYSVNSAGFQGQAAVAILLSSPNATTQRWLMFFPEWKEWFEWTSDIFSSINNGEHFLGCGASLKNKVYNFPATDNWQDAGTAYPFSTQFRLPGNGGRFMHMYGVDADSDTSANSLTVEQSIDDCVSFQTLGTIDMTADRKVLFRGGLARKRFMRLSATNARPIRIANFVARIS